MFLLLFMFLLLSMLLLLLMFFLLSVLMFLSMYINSISIVGINIINLLCYNEACSSEFLCVHSYVSNAGPFVPPIPQGILGSPKYQTP